MCNKRSKLTQSSVIDWQRCQNACVLPLYRIELWNLSSERWPSWKRWTCLINLCQIKVSSSTQVTHPPHSFLWFCFLVGLYKWQELIKLMSIYLFSFFFFFLQHTPGISMLHSLLDAQGNTGLCYSRFETATHRREAAINSARKGIRTLVRMWLCTSLLNLGWLNLFA